ncbi:ferredoxin [uncultured Variovorax sp.]|uniref:(2Fe-2S) ferredoxin domain-containing protein n=1 Tax=uncultured Variovorax sp. TaxID=114708 RepID=UPI002635D8CE|nr:NAD(P)H-dependent oxidoreductase subunit E [uncultured Variovorax sp.]
MNGTQRQRPPQPACPVYRRHLLVCTGRRCVADGMDAAALDAVGHRLIEAGLLADGPLRVKPTRADCLGACGSGPIVCVQPDGAWYWGVTRPDMDRIIEKHLLGGQVVANLLFHTGPSGAAPGSTHER